jgi:hypothetical protein
MGDLSRLNLINRRRPLPCSHGERPDPDIGDESALDVGFIFQLRSALFARQPPHGHRPQAGPSSPTARP